MIKLFVIDLDGCLAFPFQQPNWEAFHKISEFNAKAKTDEHIPALSICTGRPHPFTESIAQLMGIYKPVIFESGGGMYNIITNELRFNAKITPAVLLKIQSMKDWIENELLIDYPDGYPEFTKKTDCGIVHPSTQKIQEMLPKVEAQKDLFGMDDFEIHFTEVSINVIYSNCNKGVGLQTLADELGLNLSTEIAYIGDSGGDIPALKLVSEAFAPSNAIDQVKNLGSVRTMKEETTKAVLSAYEYLIQINKTDKS
jgi:HAD superfamily hydrolase (TIGR01484 family)